MLLASYECQFTDGRTEKVEISAEIPGLPEEVAKRIASNHAHTLIEELRCEVVKARPDFNSNRQVQLAEYVSIFRDAGWNPIRVDLIPNRYWGDHYGLDKPWAEVQTTVGKFMIGWRKRVIQLSWEDVEKLPTSEEIFPDQDVTKSGKMIHAWSTEKATEYLTRLRCYYELK